MKSEEKRHPTTAILLAAGLGRRLLPHTLITPKPLLKVGSRPIIDYIIKSLEYANIKKLIVVTGHLQDQVRNYLEDKKFQNFDISFKNQETINGSAGGLKDIDKHLINSNYCLITATDYKVNESYFKELIDYHTSNTCDITISLREVDIEKLSESSITVFNKDGTINEIIEKPSQYETSGEYLSSTLIYIVPSNINKYVELTEISKRKEYELPRVINTMLRYNFIAKGFKQENLEDWEIQYK